MTLNCYKFKFCATSQNFGEQMFVVNGVTVKNAREGWFNELCPIYQGCLALSFALARLSCLYCILYLLLQATFLTYANERRLKIRQYLMKLWKQVRMYFGLATVAHTASQWRYTWRAIGFSRNDVMAVIFKVWRRIRNLTPPIDAYSILLTHSRNNPSKVHLDRIWNDGALGFSEERRLNKHKNKKNNNTSSNVGSVDSLSVPDPTREHHYLAWVLGVLEPITVFVTNRGELQMKWSRLEVWRAVDSRRCSDWQISFTSSPPPCSPFVYVWTCRAQRRGWQALSTPGNKVAETATDCCRSYSRRKRQHCCPKRQHFNCGQAFTLEEGGAAATLMTSFG